MTNLPLLGTLLWGHECAMRLGVRQKFKVVTRPKLDLINRMIQAKGAKHCSREPMLLCTPSHIVMLQN